MKFSNIIRSGNNLVNYYSSPIENCVTTIAMNKILPSEDVIIGINCFDELLFKSELISYARDNYHHEIKGKKILFFSKSLNLYVYQSKIEDVRVKYLNDGNEITIGYFRLVQIKSLKFHDREVLRILYQDFYNNITLYFF